MYAVLPQHVKVLVDMVARIKLVPRLKKKIPLKSTSVRIILPFSYASLGVRVVEFFFCKSYSL